MLTNSSLMTEDTKLIPALLSTVPSSSTPTRVSLKNADRVTVIIMAKNATTVTGSAITLKQSQDVSGTGEKALGFAKVALNNDTGAGDSTTDTAVVSNSFTLNNTNSKNILAVIEVRAQDLDVDNGFDCIRVGTGDATAQTLTVLYVMRSLRFSGNPPASAIVD